MPRRRDPNSWTSVRLPERELSEILLEIGAPLLEQLGDSASLDDVRAVIARVVSFWNANVLGSPWREQNEPKQLNELKKRMRGRQASRADAIVFDLLAARCRKHFGDPRLVESWSYEADPTGVPRLSCATCLPEGVRVQIAPPTEKRIAIGGTFLDEVRISLGGNSYLGFPVERHRGVINDDGSATVYAMMPSVVQLFAEGRLPRVGGGHVDVTIGGRALGPMTLTKVACGNANHMHDVAELTFRSVAARP